ncbi:MAG: AtpZ/AtpI family protein [bacterium]
MAKIKKNEKGLIQNFHGDGLKNYQNDRVKKPKTNIMMELAPYASLGMQLVITIVIGAYAGWWIDGKYDTEPWFLIVLTFFGAIAGMVNFIRTVTKRKK